MGKLDDFECALRINRGITIYISRLERSKRIFTGGVWNELPQSKPDGFASSLWEGAFGIAGKFLAKVQALQVGTLPRGELSRSD